MIAGIKSTSGNVLICLFIASCLPRVTTADITYNNSQIVQPERYYAPHLEFGGYYFTDTPHTAGVLRGFLPIGVDSPYNLMYIDARGIVKKGGVVKEGNLGLGYRHLNDFSDKLYGVYGFFDRKRTSNYTWFSQFTFGLEYWNQHFFTGGNFYMPIGKRFSTAYSNTSNASLNQTSPGVYNILVTTNSTSSTEIALVGADFSLGYQFGENLIAYAGVYHFNSSTNQYSSSAVQGPMLDLQYTFYPETNMGIGLLDRITAETQLQYDSVRGTRFYGGVRVSIAFGKRKLKGMQRRMVDPAYRDIDLVVNSQTTSSSTQAIATNTQGNTIVVKQVSTTSEANALIGETNTVIAVQGTIADFNSSNATLGDNQAICGGTYQFSYDDQVLSVPVGSNGALQSVSASNNLVLVGKNNSIQDITLTMVSPNNTAAGNIAIQANTGTTDIGTLSINNVTSNGCISIARTGASQTGSVLIYDSDFSTPSTWNPSVTTTAVGNFSTSNGANLSVDTDNCTFKSVASTQRVAGVRFQVNANGSKMTINAVNNSTIVGTGSGLEVNIGGNVASGTAQVTFTDGIYNSNISTSASTAQVALFIFRQGANTATFQMDGAIQNNTLSGPTEGILIADSTNTTLPFTATVSKGIVGNNIASNGSNISLSASRSADTYNIVNLKSNVLSLNGSTGRISINAVTATSVINISVGNGSTGLAASNGNPVLLTLGSGTRNVTPGL